MAELYIKNMVCGRCIMVVKEELQRLGYRPLRVELGFVEIEGQMPAGSKLNDLIDHLKALGFELLDDARTRLIDKIKALVINRVHYSDPEMKMNWSDVIASELNHDYNALSTLFSSVEGITIEQYIIRQKIEKAKELLFYDELSISEIAYKLGYSSVQHLSSQFRRITGQTPSQFKALRASQSSHRKGLDEVIN